MSAQDKTEKILRELHIALSKGEAVPKQPEKVIVDRQKMTDLLKELNACMYEIMDEHEMTLRSRDKAERDFRRKSEEIINDATKNAEDIYAAAFMYTDEALLHVQDIMRENTESLERMFTDMKEKLQKETRLVKSNQLELKSQLQDLKDTEKYLNLIKDRNREIEKQKKEGVEEPREEGAFYAGRKTDIKINMDYFERAGITPEQEVPAETEAPQKAEVVIKVADSIQAAEKASKAEKTLKAGKTSKVEKTEKISTAEPSSQTAENSEKAATAVNSAVQNVGNKQEEAHFEETAKETIIPDLQLMDNLDAEYFQWKEEQGEKAESPEKLSSTRDLTESLQKVWKAITQHN